MKINIILLGLFFFLFSQCTPKNRVLQTQTKKYTESKVLQVETVPSIFIHGKLEYANDHKLVIFIAGSGPTDRDCNNNAGLKTDAFKKLALYLLENNISSFRFDKRGIGASTAVEESDMIFDSFINDVTALANFFEKDFKDIILLGHSEGALIGSIASQAENIHSFISVSGISTSLDAVVLDQIGKFPDLVAPTKKHIEEVKNGGPLSEVSPFLKSLFRPSLIPFLKSAFERDPALEISKVKKPVLIISGECDIQVPIEHAKGLHHNCENSQLVIVPNMGHAMKQLKPSCGNVSEAYTNPELPLNEKFKNSILEFLME